MLKFQGFRPAYCLEFHEAQSHNFASTVTNKKKKKRNILIVSYTVIQDSAIILWSCNQKVMRWLANFVCVVLLVSYPLFNNFSFENIWKLVTELGLDSAWNLYFNIIAS